MTDQPLRSDSPHQLLSSVRDLTRQVRIAQRGTWFPLLVLAAVTFAAIPVVWYGPHHPGPCRSDHGATACSVVSPWSLVYWPVALVLAYAAIAAFYLYRSRRRGVGSRIRPYVVVGVAVAVLLAGLSLWLLWDPPAPAAAGEPLTQLVFHLASPPAAIGLALLVLAWVERNPALSLFTLVYLLVVLLPGSVLPPVHVERVGSPRYVLPLLVPAVVLLLGSLGFAVIRRAR